MRTIRDWDSTGQPADVSVWLWSAQLYSGNKLMEVSSLYYTWVPHYTSLTTCSLINPLLWFYWAARCCSGALTGILECVRLSASPCLDKAACPLSLMPQLGWGMPPCSWIRKTAEGVHSEGRAGQAGRAHWPRPQLSALKDGALSGARGW